MNKEPVTAHLNPNDFMQLYLKYDKIGVPDPTQTAINELMYPVRPTIGPHARQQLETLVAYWRTVAKPGRVLAAMRSYHYVRSLAQWDPKGRPQ